MGRLHRQRHRGSRRFGSVSSHPSVASWGIFQENPRIAREHWQGLKPGHTRIEVEIGPGDGGFLVEAAQRTPQTLWLGFEVRPSSVRVIHERRPFPENLIALHADGRWVVENLLDEATIDAFHVYFPDPWWKKRHHKRRLFTNSFANAVNKALVPGGQIHVMTDVAPRFAEIREALNQAGMVETAWADAERPGRSSYEKKYLNQGRVFHATSFERSPLA